MLTILSSLFISKNMSTSEIQTEPRVTVASLSIAAFGVLSLVAVCYLAFRTPEWYAYLNWKPGLAALVDRASLIALLLTTVVSLRMAIAREPAYVLLMLAGFLGLVNAQDIARNVGYASGVAKVECWSPASRECLLNKFERTEKLKAPSVPVVLTEKESAVFVSFKAARDKFEASKPSWSSNEFKPWAAEYRAELDKVFAGYPSAYSE